MSSINYSIPNTLAIGLGANIKSCAGPPKLTLITVRPIIENTITEWANDFLMNNAYAHSIRNKLDFNWSPLYKTKPIGGPKDQPDFINAVLIVSSGDFKELTPSKKAALDLLKRLCKIEKKFGRQRIVHWGPRSLDIDLLAWGNLHIQSKALTLPHPRLIERDFVIIPLAEALKTKSDETPIRMMPVEGWKE